MVRWCYVVMLRYVSFVNITPSQHINILFYNSGENNLTSDSARRCMNGRFRSLYTLRKSTHSCSSLINISFMRSAVVRS